MQKGRTEQKKVEYRLGAFEMEKLRKCLKNNKMRRQGCLRICQGCDKVVSSLFFSLGKDRVPSLSPHLKTSGPSVERSEKFHLGRTFALHVYGLK